MLSARGSRTVPDALRPGMGSDSSGRKKPQVATIGPCNPGRDCAGQSVFALGQSVSSPIEGSEAWADARRETTRPRRLLLSAHAHDNAVVLVLGDWQTSIPQPQVAGLPRACCPVHRRWLIIGTFSGEGFQAGAELLRMIEDTRLAPCPEDPAPDRPDCGICGMNL
jgi:hypothetical protein